MASIQDLVQQKVKQSQSGQNQFADPTAGTIFDIIKMIESNKDKANIQDRQLLIDVNQLSVGASSPTEFENISNVLNNLSPSPELQPIQQSLLTGIENKTAIYNSALPHFQEVAASFGKGDPRLDKYTFTKGKILNLKASDTPEGKKGLDFLRTEIERVGLMKEHLNNAKGFNYAKHSNIPMKSVIDKVDKYYETLNEAFLAAPGGISPREANAIFFGDYGDVQKQRISFITGQMEDERTRVNSLKRKLVSTQNSYRAEVARAQTGGGGINTAAFFPDFTEDEQSKGAPTGDSATYKDIVDFYVKEIDDIENSEHGTLKALKTEYNFWSIEGPLEGLSKGKEESTQERLNREAQEVLDETIQREYEAGAVSEGIAPTSEELEEEERIKREYEAGVVSEEVPDLTILTDEFTKNQSRISEINKRISELDTIASTKNERGVRNINNMNFDMRPLTEEKNKLIDELESIEKRNVDLAGQKGMLPPVIVRGKKAFSEGTALTSEEREASEKLDESFGNLEEVDSGGIGWDSFNESLKDPNIVVPGAVTAVWGANKLWEVTSKARKHIGTMLKTTDEAKLMNFVRDGDMLDDMLKIDKTSEELKVMQQKLKRGATKKITDPVTKIVTDTGEKAVHSYQIKSKLDKLKALEKAFADKFSLKHNFTNQDMINLVKSRDKWNIWKAKSKIMPILREAGYTLKDIGNVLKSKALHKPGSSAFWVLAPFEVGEKMSEKIFGPDHLAAEIFTGLGALKVTSMVRNKWKSNMRKKSQKEVADKLKNPKVWGKIGKLLLEKSPWLAGKIGLAGVGITIPEGISSAIGYALMGSAVKDIYDLAMELPELYAILFEDRDPDDFTYEKGAVAKGGDALENISNKIANEYSARLEKEYIHR